MIDYAENLLLLNVSESFHNLHLYIKLHFQSFLSYLNSGLHQITMCVCASPEVGNDRP